MIASPDQFAADRSFASDGLNRSNVSAPWPETGWWSAYGDPQLTTLIEEALSGSPDVRTAAARVRRAEAYVEQVGSERLPRLDLEGSASATKQSYDNGIPAALVPRGWNSSGRAAADFSFDLDLWGGRRAAYAAARSEAEAARLDLAQSSLILSTSIADAYADLARLFAERSVQATALQVRQGTAKLTADRVASGLDTQAELKQAQAAVPAARADIAATDEQIALTRDRLAALLGKGPDRGLAIIAPTAAIAPRGIPRDATIELIGRRPDIVAARARVEAAASRIKVARADFYPAINLSAVLGSQSLGLANLFKGGSFIGDAGPAISLPIFRGGELQGRYRGARAAYDEAVADYDRTVADAYRAVADAVASQRAFGVRLSESQEALDDSDRAYAAAKLRYEGGLSTFLDVLTAQDRALQALRIVTDLKARALTLDVALVRALGGGFVASARASSKENERG